MNPDRKSSSLLNDQLSNTIYFFSGMAVVLMGYSVYSHLKTLHDHNNTKKNSGRNGAKLEDSIQLKSLAYLTQSHNVNIQSSSTKIILERAMSATYLPKVIASCDKSQSIETRSKALPALQLLTRKENNKTALLEAGALSVLVDALKCTDPEMKEVTQRYVAVAICDLIQGNDANKQRTVDLGVLDPIKRILSSDQIRNNELKYWTLMILYQISLSEPLPRVLVDYGFVCLLAKMARMTYGNTNMPKFCMQSLVRITSNVDANEAKRILTELLDYSIVDLISNCLRGDDVELIYWAAGLMHEFVLKDVAADRFRRIKGIHTILAGLLSAEEMYISRVILRTIKFMAFGQDNFRSEMVRSGIVKKIMHCLSLDDEDVRYWTILCLHVFAGQVESHEDIVSAQEFDILMELALSPKIKVSIFISDILSLICCVSSNHSFMESNLNLIVKTLDALLIQGELDVQYNAAAAIFNVMTMTYTFSCKIRDTCFENLTRQCVSGSHERIQLTCAKGVLEVAIKNPFLLPQVNNDITEPLIDTIESIAGSLLPIMITQALMNAASQSQGKSASLNWRKSKSSAAFLHDVEKEGKENNRAMLLDPSVDSSYSNQIPERTPSPTPNTLFDEMSFLLDTSVPLSERGPSLEHFELSATMRSRLVGALAALNILAGNDQIIGYLVTGQTNRYPSSMLDDITIGVDDMDASIYKCMMKARQEDREQVATTDELLTTSCLALPRSICAWIEALVRLSLYPTLDSWASRFFQDHSLDALDREKADKLYEEVIQWICRFVELPTRDYLRARFRQGVDVQDDSSDSSDESDDSSMSSDSSTVDRIGMLSVHRQKVQQGIDDHTNNLAESNTRYSEDRDDIYQNNSRLVSTYPLPTRNQTDSTMHQGRETKRKDLSAYALTLLNSISRYALIRQHLIQESSFLSILAYLYENDSSPTDCVMSCLGNLFTSSASNIVIHESNFARFAILLWRDTRALSLLEKKSYLFYSRLVLTYCSHYIASELQTSSIRKDDHVRVGNHPAFIEIDLVSRSKYCLINYENRLQVRNNSWTFETVKATHCVPPLMDRQEADTHHKYAYEIVLESSGLMQVGWVTEQFEFDPEGGQGVGDDIHSYGYDGDRSKKWHGRYTSVKTSYGLKWSEGDIVTCAIDLDAGEIRYYKNGVDMGVAFTNVPSSQAWYPALSLSTGQQCRFQFGGSMDRLKYLPEGYIPVGSLAHQSSMGMELPPPRFPSLEPTSSKRTNETEESEIVEPNEKTQNPEDPGNIEPNIRPIDGTVFSSLKKLTETPLLIDQDSLQQHAFSLELVDVYKKPLPSLYFEVTIGFLQHGYESASPGSFIFGLKGLHETSAFYFEYNKMSRMCHLEFRSSCSNPIHIQLNDGDIVGMLYIQRTNEVGFTLNGSIKALVSLGDCLDILPYIPFATGIEKYQINYGERPYNWKTANSVEADQRVSHYLSQLL
ncbi:hypothetical protein BD560DRAFT_395831 [Blakeslea trispora]|nr:hypothetical protein BD560DRAFT_395831 [Blakeslea trispora]